VFFTDLLSMNPFCRPSRDQPIDPTLALLRY